MMNDVLATKTYVVKRGDEEYHYTLHLVPHGGFEYGNGHALILNRHDGSWEDCFDARYDNRFATVDSFNKFAYEFIREQTSDEFTVEEVTE
ncbi:MAG: hypothetical protein K6F61_04125 [Clostridiales bacterium]|nr:hypothetical protein [Clostridiales bacterium]